MGRAAVPKSAIALFPANLLIKTGLTQIFPGDFWPKKVKNVKAAGFRDFRLKILDASLRFWRRFSGFSILEFLINKIVFFWHAQFLNSDFAGQFVQKCDFEISVRKLMTRPHVVDVVFRN